MDALKSMYENLGFSNVASYVQSGNLVFTEKNTDPNILEQKISDQIKKDFGFDVPVIILTADKLKQIIDNNPFLNDSDKDESFLHITFLSSVPNNNNEFETIEDKAQNGEEIVLSGDVVYLYCPNGYGNTKLSNNFLETKLKVKATTRNWKTTNELYKIL